MKPGIPSLNSISAQQQYKPVETSSDDAKANEKNGTVPFEAPPVQFSDKETYDLTLEVLKEIGAPFPFLEETPDKWILAIMHKLRHSAINLADYREFRRGLINAAAACMACILRGDGEFRDFIALHQDR